MQANTSKQDEMFSYPTVAELAGLAAALARSRIDDAGELAGAALRLWKAAMRELQADRRQAEQIPQAAEAAKEPPLPTPKSFPVSREEVLRLLMPNTTSKERLDVYRDACRSNMRLHSSSVPSDAEVNDMVRRKLEEPVQKQQYADFAYWLRRHFDEHHRRQISEKRRLAARKKHAKELAAKYKVSAEQILEWQDAGAPLQDIKQMAAWLKARNETPKRDKRRGAGPNRDKLEAIAEALT